MGSVRNMDEGAFAEAVISHADWEVFSCLSLNPVVFTSWSFFHGLCKSAACVYTHWMCMCVCVCEQPNLVIEERLSGSTMLCHD